MPGSSLNLLAPTVLSFFLSLIFGIGGDVCTFSSVKEGLTRTISSHSSLFRKKFLLDFIPPPPPSAVNLISLQGLGCTRVLMRTHLCCGAEGPPTGQVSIPESSGIE